MVEYTIAMCNYNMDETIERSIQSIIEQVDERYEVLLVDDGSTDRSVDILKDLESIYNNLRCVLLERDSDRELNGTRHIAVKESKGEYVFVNMDTDDVYESGIQDFVKIYKEIEKVRDDMFFLKGYSIDLAPRDLLLEIPYRNIGRGGDKDLWRRLFANDAMIWLEHDPFWRQIGYTPDKQTKAINGYKLAETDFRSGVSLPSFIRHNLNEVIRPEFGNRRSGAYEAIIAPIAYLQALQKGRYSQSGEYKKKGKLKETIRQKKAPLPELESELGFHIDRNELSEVGKKAFLPDTPSPVDWKTVLS